MSRLPRALSLCALTLLWMTPALAQSADPGPVPAEDPGPAVPPEGPAEVGAPSEGPAEVSAPPEGPAEVGAPTEAGAPPEVAHPAEAGAPAEAGSPAPAPASVGPAAPRRQGVLVGLGFGAHGCTDDWCRNLDPMVYLRLSALYRVARFVAVGLHMGFLFNDVDRGPEAPDSLSVVSWHMILGPEVRGIFQIKALDLWAGMVLGYQRAQTDWSDDGDKYSAYAHGFGFGGGIGADYYLASSIALGLNFWLYKPLFFRECTTGVGEASGCAKVESQDRIGINWTVGVNATFFFGK